MLTKTITFTNYDGEEVTRTYMFNLTRSELTKLEVETPGGFSNMLQEIIDTKNAAKIMETFTKIIKMSYGVKSPDGETFIKSAEAYERFEQSPAYDELFMELVTNADKAAAFVNGILPKIPNNVTTIPAPKN